jgi:hypothetical protein
MAIPAAPGLPASGSDRVGALNSTRAIALRLYSTGYNQERDFTRARNIRVR